MADDLNGWDFARRLEKEEAAAAAVEEVGPWRRGVEVEIEGRERWRVERGVRVRRRRREYNNAIAGGCSACWSELYLWGGRVLRVLWRVLEKKRNKRL